MMENSVTVRVKTEDLIGAALDWAVVVCENDVLAALNIQYPEQASHYVNISPSTNGSQGINIIEREKIYLMYIPESPNHDGCWAATLDSKIHFREDPETCEPVLSQCNCYGPTLLIAAMRVYVMSMMGEEIDIPENLV